MALPFTTHHSITYRPREWETGWHMEEHGRRPVCWQGVLGMSAVAEKPWWRHLPRSKPAPVSEAVQVGRRSARAWMSGGRAGSAGGKVPAHTPWISCLVPGGCFYKFAELWWIKAPVSDAGCCKFTRLPNLLEKYREKNCLQVNAGLKNALFTIIPTSSERLNVALKTISIFSPWFTNK